jgi:hypothetical protein
VSCARHAVVVVTLLVLAGCSVLIFFGYIETDVDDHE